MATKKITGLHDGTITVKTSGNTYNIMQNATVVGSADSMSPDPVGAITESLSAMPPLKNNTYNIDGRVIGVQAGIFTSGIGDEIHVGATGKVSGAIGLAMTGNNSIAINDGVIDATAGYGMVATEGSKIHLTNNGDITGVIGMAVTSADKAQIINGAHGDIVALEYGVQLGTSSGESAKFVNHGSVLASISMGAAVMGGSGDENVVNDGKLMGHVVLGDGSDTFDDRGGTVQGSIVGGSGDDMLITSKASDKLFEDLNGGDDTVRSTVSYKLSANVENLFLLGKADIDGTGTIDADKLHGNDGKNNIKGLGGDDQLWGGKGNDHLTGGAGADTFHFVKGDGDDVITHFDQGADLIDVSEWTGIDKLADVLSHAHDQGAGTKIEFGNDSLLIANVHKADLTDADFTFAA